MLKLLAVLNGLGVESVQRGSITGIILLNI